MHNVMNALAAATVAHRLGMPLDRIAAGLADVKRISPHRMAVSAIVKPEARFTLIDDSFNANPDSMKAGLDGLIRWHANDERQPFRIAVWVPCLNSVPMSVRCTSRWDHMPCRAASTR